MSASEKLEELHPLLTGPPAQAIRDGARDQIIAVVEAAEDARPYEHEPTASYLAETIPEDRMIRLRLALAALEKALDGGEIRDSKLTDRFDWNSRDGVTFDAGRDEA